MAEYAYTPDELRNKGQQVRNQINKKENDLDATVKAIDDANDRLDQANDERTVQRWNAKLETLQEREKALRAELVELQGQVKHLEAQRAALLRSSAAVAPVPAPGMEAPPVGANVNIALPPDVSTTLEGLKAMELEKSYEAGQQVQVPHLCVSSGQSERSGNRPIIFRECFNAILDRVSVGLDSPGIFFEDERPIYVYGPKGIGKSHALRFVVARLWERRLANAPFRLLYVAEWHKATMPDLLQDLMLCFHDDPEMLHKIARLSTFRHVHSSDIVSLLRSYSAKRLLVVADQAFDSQMHVEAESFFQFFPTGSRSLRVVFSSSPRFKLQGLYLAGEPTFAVLHPFMDKLSDRECLAVAWDVLGRLSDPSPVATEVRRHLGDLVHSLGLEADVTPVQAEARHVETDVAPMQEADSGPASAEETPGIKILQRLQETTGGVPLYVREILTVHSSAGTDFEDACRRFNETRARDVFELTRVHYRDLDGLQVEYLLRFLASAVALDQVMGSDLNRNDWAVRDLRFVRLVRKGNQQPRPYVEPLCPAAYQGLARFLMAVALETEEQDAAALVAVLQAAIDTGGLPPSAVGFAKEHIFLTKLACWKARIMTATLSSAANPTSASGGIEFLFERVRFIPSFGATTRAVAQYDASGASVLFIPREPNEPYVDAAVYNYRSKTVYAIQVTGQQMKQHKSSLDFFTAASNHRWKTLVPADEADEWRNLYMIWVLTNIDRESSAPTSATVEGRTISEYQIDYDAFVRGSIADDKILHRRTRDSESKEDFDEHTVDGKTVEALKAYCDVHGIHYPSKPKRLLIQAIVRSARGWALSDEQYIALRAHEDRQNVLFVNAEDDIAPLKRKRLDPATVAPKKSTRKRRSSRKIK